MGFKEIANNVLNQQKEKFDSLSEEEKEKSFLSTIDEIKLSQDFQNFEKWWDKQSFSKKMKYYKDGEVISVEGSINYASKAPGTLDISLNPFKKPKVRGLPDVSLNPFKRSKTKVKEGIETSIYEQTPRLMRLGVSFGLLKKPLMLSEKTLLKNIATDAHTLKQNLGIFKKVCAVVPQLMALYPIIQKLLPYAEWYEKHGAALIQERIKTKKSISVEKSVTTDLSSVKQDIVKTDVLDKNK